MVNVNDSPLREQLLALQAPPSQERGAADDQLLPRRFVERVMAEIGFRSSIGELPPVRHPEAERLARKRLRRGVPLFARDRRALADERLELDAVFRTARWLARRDLHALAGRLPPRVLDPAEDRLTRRYVRQALGADRARRDACRLVGLDANRQPAVERDPLGRLDAVAVLAALQRRATPAERRLLGALAATEGDRRAAAEALGLKLPALRKALERIRRKTA